MVSSAITTAKHLHLQILMLSEESSRDFAGISSNWC
jgi:hypothetical protein